MQATTPRVFAGIIALIGWIALVVQARATLALTGSIGETLWVMGRYFTVLTNLLVAIVMTGVALGVRRFAAPFLLGATTLSILLVGVIYMTLLRGMLELSGGALLADFLLHQVVPLLMPLWWLAFAPKGRLGWHDPWWWSLFPLAYLAYALARGAAEGNYAYPFIDVARNGLATTLLNALLIALGFLVAGAALVWLDGRLERRARSG